MRSDGSFWRLLLGEMEQGHLPFRNTELVTVLKADLHKAFLDESGNNDAASFFVIAGFIGSPRRWLHLDSAWRAALKAAHMKSFKSTKFFRGQKPLPPKKMECLNNLLLAVAASELRPFGALIDLNAFNALAYGERKYLSGGYVGDSEVPPKPYYLAFHHCIAQAAKKTKHGKKVQIVFDQQSKYSPRALELLVAIKEKLPPKARAKIGPCTFEDRKEIGPPLEAADLLAHCWYTNKQYGAANRIERQYALSVLMGRKIHHYGLADFMMLIDRELSPEQIAMMRAEMEP